MLLGADFLKIIYCYDEDCIYLIQGDQRLWFQPASKFLTFVELMKAAREVLEPFIEKTPPSPLDSEEIMKELDQILRRRPR